ncbi:DUF4179 domain-containing protein [Clostridium sp. YIM B02506]|uniref:DUF4179 domain-containing protein n=1 Tax=Clostridium sp. YIM B02506 TaxID=2910680 RepID=UPI001EEE4E4C|nr:DUF4179 domain-containing protein [Clostridium sp. YIM B02506]
MDDLNNIKEMIKIPEGIDLAVKKGFERGKKEKKRRKHKKIYKRIGAIAATLALVVIVGINNPEIVQAIPGVGSIFKLIDYDRMGRNLSAYEKFATSINKSVENNGIKVTIDEIAIDDNSLVITSTIEGDGLQEERGYMTPDIVLNGKQVGNFRNSDKKVSDKKLVSVITANVSDLTLDNNINVYLNMHSIGNTVGLWEFKFNVAKMNNVSNSKVINLDKNIKIPNSTLTLDKMTISPLGNTINYSGKYDSKNASQRNGIYNFIVMDENKKIIAISNGGTWSSTERYEGKIEIFDDLSDVNSLTVVPIFKVWGTKPQEINDSSYTILQTTNNKSEDHQEIISKSRPVTKDEKRKGYSLDEVISVYNIDKNREFVPIGSLVNQTIKVSDNNSVKIKNIEVTDEYTKLTFKLEGNGAYNYRNINESIILDEDYKDTRRAEDGDIAVMENQAEKIVSIKLPAVDKNKKYKIAIPMITEPEIDDRYKIEIDLSK